MKNEDHLKMQDICDRYIYKFRQGNWLSDYQSGNSSGGFGRGCGDGTGYGNGKGLQDMWGIARAGGAGAVCGRGDGKGRNIVVFKKMLIDMIEFKIEAAHE